MPRLEPLADVRAGERWVLRVRLPDGSATDLVGWVDTVDAEMLRLADADGTSHAVRSDEVILARRAPAARGGPDPRRVSADELEHLSCTGWLAFSEPLGEWTLRSGGGFTGRANSALAVGDPGVPMDEAAERVIGYAASHHIDPMAQVVTGSPVDQALRELGWTDVYVPTDMLATRLADLLGDHLPDPRVTVTETLEPSWEEAYGWSRPNSADPAVLRMILAGRPPRAFGAVPGAGGLVTIARGHLSADWLGLASIWTDEGHRRQGLATATMRALGHWAARRGARYSYLQVASANASALAAYARLGFVRHHRYHYLAPP